MLRLERKTGREAGDAMVKTTKRRGYKSLEQPSCSHATQSACNTAPLQIEKAKDVDLALGRKAAGDLAFETIKVINWRDGDCHLLSA
jgi:DNA-binding winged helix-turn-helix (wHTH) protein